MRVFSVLKSILSLLLPVGLLLGFPLLSCAAGGLPIGTVSPGAGGGQDYTLSLQTLILLTSLTFIPAAMLMMTGFTRIVIVLSLLRQALGTQSAPSNQVLIGLALFITFFCHGPGVRQDLYRRLPAFV